MDCSRKARNQRLDYVTRRQIEYTITWLARQAGFQGDPFAPTPTIFDPNLEFAAECLVLDAAIYENTPKQKRFARQIARAIVFSSHQHRGAAI